MPERELTDNDAAVARLRTRVAKRLAAMDWTRYAVTADFVVIAIDMEIESQAQIERSLRASAPKRIVNALKKQGLLHVAP
jgi:hypothetical protein